MALRLGSRAARHWLMLALGLVLLFDPALFGGRGAAADDRPVGAKLLGESASLLTRAAPDQPWRVVKQGESLPFETLLLAVPAADVEVKSGRVRLQLLADLDGRTPLPIIESAVVLHNNAEADVDFTLDRGRVTVTNTRSDQAPATVVARFRDQVWKLRLLSRRATFGLEIYGRWPQGVPFTPTPTAKDVPALDAVLLVTAGQVELKAHGHQYLMKAPPGRAIYRWDSTHGPEHGPENLNEAPAWAKEIDPNAPELAKRRASLNRFRELLLNQSIEAAIDEFSASDDENRRRLAIYAIGALDLLPRLGKTLMESTHPEDWDNAVTAMRHWLGRGPGQDLKMYNALIKERKATPAQAAIVLQLLHRFSEEECGHPELYELLIEYLRSDLFAVRGLGHWHLKRLVPEGKKIAYNPNGSKEEIDRAYKAWKQLVPTGKLPPSPTKSN